MEMKCWLSWGLIIVLGCLLGLLGCSLWDKTPIPIERVVWSSEAQWIAPQQPSYRFYARQTFYIGDRVEGGWIRISADNDFILYVNGQSIARETSIINNSLGIASKLSDKSQQINDSLAYRSNNEPQLLLSNTQDWRVAVYVDLTNYLHAGKNVIALEVQKSRENPRVALEGEVYSVPSVPIKLTTGVTPWQYSVLSETRGKLQWFEPDFPAQDWAEAKVIGGVKEATYSRLSSHLFDRLLQGSWISSSEGAKGDVWLQGSWNLAQTNFVRSFVRFSGVGNYALTINGQLVNNYAAADGSQLHEYDVTKLLSKKVNTLMVRLARPLDRNSSVSQDRPLSFFLDGWIETKDNKIAAPIATDSSWSYSDSPLAQKNSDRQLAAILSLPNSAAFQRIYEGDADLLDYPSYLWHQILWQVAGISFAFFLAWLLGRLGKSSIGAALLLPGTLFLISIGLLKHRYAEADRGLLFAQTYSDSTVLLSFIGIIILTMLWRSRSQLWLSLSLYLLLGLVIRTGFGQLQLGLLVALGCLSFMPLIWVSRQIAWQPQVWERKFSQLWVAWGQWVLLGAIITVGFALRAYDLGFLDLSFDENVSLDPARAILRTGIPEAASGVWYTRSPAYHYMLALWLRFFGDSTISARFLSVIWGTATLVLTFVFTRKVTGKVWIALLVTALLAIDPWAIMVARLVRFYQVVQFFSLLSFYLFIKGFIDREGRWYQHSFFIAITFTILNQEVTITLLPCFLVGFLFFYRPFRLIEDRSIIFGSLMTVIVSMYDIVFFGIKCLTPWVTLGLTTDSIIKPHLAYITAFSTSFFVGNNRMYVIYSFLFFLGLIYFLKHKNDIVLFLYSGIFVNLFFLTTLVRQIANRYFYTLQPLFLLLAVYSGICIIQSLGSKLELSLKSLLPLKRVAIAFLLLLLFLNVEPERVLAGYQDTLFRRNSEVIEYVRDRRQPKDVLISSSASAAAEVLGGLDYYLLAGTVVDAIYWHDGRIIDRWAGGVVVTNLDRMSQILENVDRVWIHLDDGNEKKFDADFVNYFKTLGKPVVDSFGTRLRLWQRQDGLLPRLSNQGKDLGNF